MNDSNNNNKVVYSRDPVKIVDEPKLDLSLFKKRSSAKTYPGYLIGKMKQGRDSGNFEVVALIQHFYKKYLEYETSERFKQDMWKGKSGLSFIDKPDRVICISYQKVEPGDTPKEIRTEITKEEINQVLGGIVSLFDGDELIPTRDVAELIYKKTWKNIFSDRNVHIKLTKILNYLEYRKHIEYHRSGKIKVLQQNLK